jgi:hypothetical protein
MPQLCPDRLATLYFFRPLQRLLQRVSAGTPILMHHSISIGQDVSANSIAAGNPTGVLRSIARVLTVGGHR